MGGNSLYNGPNTKAAYWKDKEAKRQEKAGKKEANRRWRMGAILPWMTGLFGKK